MDGGHGGHSGGDSGLSGHSGGFDGHFGHHHSHHHHSGGTGPDGGPIPGDSSDGRTTGARGGSRTNPLRPIVALLLFIGLCFLLAHFSG